MSKQFRAPSYTCVLLESHRAGKTYARRGADYATRQMDGVSLVVIKVK
jgi:hypothetical protein